MTDAFRPDDELVSAVLDGEATPDERARVQADPALSARLGEFAAVRDRVAEPLPPADETARERAVAAAKVAVRHQAPVVPLRPRRDVPRFLAVAAAVLVVLLGVGLLVDNVDLDRGGDSGSSDTAAGGADSAGEDDAAFDATAESADAAADGGAGSPRLEGADLGAVADEADLRSAIERVTGTAATVGGSATTSAPAPPNLPQAVLEDDARGPSEDCQVGLIEADPTLSGGLLAQATTTYAGTPAVVYVYGTPEGRQRVVVVSDDACVTLAAFDL
jgi:hypothetical protein